MNIGRCFAAFLDIAGYPSHKGKRIKSGGKREIFNINEKKSDV